ncbi:MAG: FMN-binding glutamate synthase family protein [Deltaproteobacteria bacterium]|nr:FMN-binding glutamate synthase family protein [Deltaproteobacteria bacterium]
MSIGLWILVGVGGLLLLVTVYDLTQRKHAILRNFPIIGHFRYIFEAIGPELRQYIVTNNDEERPFSRDQRRWVYASAKKQNNYFGFGTDDDLEHSPNKLIIKHSAFPISAPRLGEPEHDPMYRLPCAKVLGAARDRKRAFRPASVVNISGMSFGSLSGPAVEALNRGSKIAGCLHNTGEGGVSAYHQHGGELIWQVGTGYFGCRSDDGGFNKERFLRVVEAHPVRAVELKLSQGAKPGLGGLLPAAKVTKEISRARGIPVGRDCASPSSHSAFQDVDSMLDFVEDLADSTGLPIGIKAAVGNVEFWIELAEQMAAGQRGVDYICIDGGEGGTGAAPLVFSDHVALPFKLAMSRVYRIFAERGVAEKVLWVGSGRLGFPDSALWAMGLGCDLIAVAREPMLAIGCIQAQRCHSGHCPTGVATQSKWLMRGLDPRSKAARLANYVIQLRKELLQLANACGRIHPALLTLDDFDIIDDHYGAKSARELFDYQPSWGGRGIDENEVRSALSEARTGS